MFENITKFHGNKPFTKLFSNLFCSSLGISGAEFNALHSLYQQTDGENWKWRPTILVSDNQSVEIGIPWNFTEVSNPPTKEDLGRPCGNKNLNISKWQGLGCGLVNITSTSCSILIIQLSDFGLFGRLPSSLSDLRHLQFLDLLFNDLYGSVPKNLSFPSILVINFQFNILTGSIPFSLYSNKSSMVILDLNSLI